MEGAILLLNVAGDGLDERTRLAFWTTNDRAGMIQAHTSG